MRFLADTLSKQLHPHLRALTNPIVTRVKAKAKGRSKANPNVDVSLPTLESHTNP